jgi:hypothetical protein
MILSTYSISTSSPVIITFSLSKVCFSSTGGCYSFSRAVSFAADVAPVVVALVEGILTLSDKGTSISSFF